METLTAQHIELAPGYSISRVINGCWQLSQGHALKAPVDFDDVPRPDRSHPLRPHRARRY